MTRAFTCLKPTVWDGFETTAQMARGFKGNRDRVDLVSGVKATTVPRSSTPSTAYEFHGDLGEETNRSLMAHHCLGWPEEELFGCELERTGGKDHRRNADHTLI